MAAVTTSWFVGENESSDNTDKGKRKRLKKSFLKALESKYCQHAEVEPLKYVQIVFHGKPKADSESELGYLRNVVLTDANIAVSGLTTRSLKDICPHVVDLDISGNLFDSWKSVLTIVSQLVHLKYLNLSRNPLYIGQKSLAEWHQTLPEVENLVLNSTDIPWTDVLKLTELFQQLKELHICGNGYSEIPDDDLRGMKTIEILRLNDNNFESWDQIWKLKHLARLKSLILSGNPLQDVYFLDNDVELQCGGEDYSKHTSKFDLKSLEHKHQYPNAEDVVTQSNVVETSEIYDECRNLLETLVWNIYLEPTSQGKLADSSCLESCESLPEQCQGQQEQCEGQPEHFQGQPKWCQGETDNDSHDSICDKLCDTKNVSDFITGEDALTESCDVPVSFEEQDYESNDKTPKCKTYRPTDIEEAVSLPRIQSDKEDGYSSCTGTNTVTLRQEDDCEVLDLLAQKQDNNSDQQDGLGTNTNNATPRPEQDREALDLLVQKQGKNCGEQADGKKEQPVNSERYKRPGECELCAADVDYTAEQGNGYTENKGNSVCDTGKEQVPDNSHKEGIDQTKGTESETASDIETCKSFPIEMQQGDGVKNDPGCPAGRGARLKPFHNLENICLSDTKIGKWKHLAALSAFPSLLSVRIKDIKLGARLSQEDRRKLFVPCLPNIKTLNGSEVTVTERDKGERYLLRYFCDKPKKPSIYTTLQKKHGTLTPLVDIDICRGYQERVTLTFVYEGEIVFTETVSVREPVGKLRLLIADKLCLYASLKNIKMYHKYCNPEHQSDLLHSGELEQLVLDTLPISRFDILDGDEIHVDLYDRFTFAAMQFIYIRNYLPKKKDLLDVLKSK